MLEIERITSQLAREGYGVKFGPLAEWQLRALTAKLADIVDAVVYEVGQNVAGRKCEAKGHTSGSTDEPYPISVGVVPGSGSYVNIPGMGLFLHVGYYGDYCLMGTQPYGVQEAAFAGGWRGENSQKAPAAIIESAFRAVKNTTWEVPTART